MADEHLNQPYKDLNQIYEPLPVMLDADAWERSVALDERDRQRGYTLLWIVAGFIGGWLLAMLT